MAANESIEAHIFDQYGDFIETIHLVIYEHMQKHPSHTAFMLALDYHYGFGATEFMRKHFAVCTQFPLANTPIIYGCLS